MIQLMQVNQFRIAGEENCLLYLITIQLYGYTMIDIVHHGRFNNNNKCFEILIKTYVEVLIASLYYIRSNMYN